MIAQLYKKLGSITALPPVKDNEVLIRNLAHRLLNEINCTEFSPPQLPEKEKIRQSCLNSIRLLDCDIIMNSSPEDYVYECLNLTTTVSDVLTACGVLLCRTKIRPVFRHHGTVYTDAPVKLLLSAITGIVRIFCQICPQGIIYFSLKRNREHTVLLAECVNNNRKSAAVSNETADMLKKTAEILNGAFLTAKKDTSFICALSMKNPVRDKSRAGYAPDYVELLIDKMSEVHIGLSGLSDGEKISDLH